MRKKKRLSIRYIVLSLTALCAFFIFFSEKPQGAQGLEQHTAERLPGESLSVLSPDRVEEMNLTVNWDLQEYIASTVRRNKVWFAAVVVMDAHSGDILALYGRDESGENCSLCLNAYLGASLFKVVTAAAAIDYGGMSPQSKCTYNGKAHTLYRHQLLPKQNRWTREISLARAFAQSNNVVFAKIGTTELGETPILLAAMRLGFWQPPLQSFECMPSTLFIPQTQFNLAELASGFNRHTRISPVHAAQMVTAVVNQGSMVNPRLKEDVAAGSQQVISEDAAEQLRSMMAQTIRSGTVSRTFWNSRHDRVLKNVQLGAKSGSIDGTEPDGRRNWFMGYAVHEKTGEAITIASLIIREDYYWIEADALSKKIIRYYFSRPVTVADNS